MLWMVNAFRWWGRAIGWSISVALTALGVAGSGVFLGQGGALLLAAVIAGLIAGMVAVTGSGRPFRAGTAKPARHPVVLGLAGGTVCLAVIGLIFELGAAGCWISVLVPAVGGLLLRARRRGAADFRRHASRQTSAGDPPAVEMVPVEPLPGQAALPFLSTAELCWVWRLSYARVRRATESGQLQDLARHRRDYLDELQRRNPVAFARWLPTARAAGDPARFFCRRPAPRSAARTAPGALAGRPDSPRTPDGEGADRTSGRRRGRAGGTRGGRGG
jgi:hypothetical protein